MRTRMALMVMAALSLAACKNPAQPRLTGITYQSGTSSTVVTISYSDSQIATINVTDDGTPESQMVFTYDGSDISGITITDPDEEGAANITFTYNDGKLSRIVQVQQYGGTSATQTADFTYGDDGLSRVLSTDGTNTSTTDYSYTDGLLKRILATYSGGSTITDFNYNSDDLVTSISRNDGSSTYVYSIMYNSDDKLDRITRDTSSYTVTYGDKNVSQITQQSGDYTTTIAYTYDDGSVDGLVPTPDVPFGDLFDLEGEMLPMGEVYVTSAMLD